MYRPKTSLSNLKAAPLFRPFTAAMMLWCWAFGWGGFVIAAKGSVIFWQSLSLGEWIFY